jgi:methionyl-tRNA formyltransferase
MSFGYRRLIPERIIKKAAIAALGVHFSPLPRYRGFAPLNWVLINGEHETAVNLFCLDKEIDNGDIVDREFVTIDYLDDINTLYEKCLCEFRKLMYRFIPKLESGKFEAEKQDSSKATYACARSPEDGIINWNRGSREIYNLVRALTYPFPGAYTYFDDQKLYIWSCEEYDIPKYEGLIPGKVIKIVKGTGIVVLCGTGAVLLKEGQIEGNERKTLDRIIASVRITLGN